MKAKTLKRRVAEYVVYGVLLITLFTFVTAIYWLLENPDMLVVHNAKTMAVTKDGTVFNGIPLRPQEVKPGGIVFIHLDYCKLKDVDGIVIARLVGQKFTTRLTWPNDQTKAGCVNSDVPVPIPDGSSDDTYYVEFEVLYHVNPLKDRDVILRSVTFKVAG